MKRYWRGQGRLWTVFWGYGIGGNGLLAGFLGLLVSRLPGGGDHLWPALLLLGFYNAWVVISVWRCAYNTRRRYWGDCARLLMVFWALNLLLLGLFLGLDLVLA